MLLFQVLIAEVAVGSIVFLKEIGNQLLERLLALLLRESLLHEVVGGLIELVLDLLAQLLVVDLVVILALGVGAELLHQFLLQLAHRLDSLVGGLEGADQVLLGDFVHLAFHHHDVVLRGTHHEVHVGLLHLLRRRIDDILAVDAGYAALRDGALKRDVAASHGARGGKTGQCVGLVHAVGGQKHDLDIHLRVVVGGEQGPQGAVNKA